MKTYVAREMEFYRREAAYWLERAAAEDAVSDLAVTISRHLRLYQTHLQVLLREAGLR